MNHMYMQPGGRRRNKNTDYVRTYAPYAGIALLVIVLFWGVDSIKQDNQRKQYEPGEVVQPPKDWTHKLSTATTYDDKTRPDDDTTMTCPTPLGNWGHTCDRNIIIEGPCSGKCMLKAKCQDVKEKFKETTFEFNEGRRLEIKNVNGLLCSIEDGSPSCGVNFHGNLALKNCLGYIPRRHEIVSDGLWAPDDSEKHDKPEKEKYDDWQDDHLKDPDDDEEYKRKKSKAYEEDDVKRPKRKHFDNEQDDEGYAGRRRHDDDEWKENRPQKKTYEEFEEYHPAPRKAPPMPKNKYEEPEQRIFRRDDEDRERKEERERQLRARYQDADAEEEPNDERMLRGNRRRYRPDDDEGRQRRL